MCLPALLPSCLLFSSLPYLPCLSFVLVLIPIFNKFIYPCLGSCSRRRGMGWANPKPLRRMSVGMLLGAFAFALSAWVQVIPCVEYPQPRGFLDSVLPLALLAGPPPLPLLPPPRRKSMMHHRIPCPCCGKCRSTLSLPQGKSCCQQRAWNFHTRR